VPKKRRLLQKGEQQFAPTKAQLFAFHHFPGGNLQMPANTTPFILFDTKTNLKTFINMFIYKSDNKIELNCRDDFMRQRLNNLLDNRYF